MAKLIAGCKQIVDYMKEIDLYRLYCERVLQNPSLKCYKKTLNGRQYLLRTLLGADGPTLLNDNLIWSKTPEGELFWDDRDDRIRDAFFEVELKYKIIER